MANLTPFQKKLVSIAQREHENYSLLRENQEPLKSRIAAYWKDLGFTFQSVTIPWSAVFVSWCVKQSGATKAQFRFAQAHSRFVHWALRNTATGSGMFHGRSVDEYPPKLGDILQNNRGGKKLTIKYASEHQSYESHSAIVSEVGTDGNGNYLRTIGGNEGDSVGLKEVRLDASWRVRNSDGLYILVVETLM